MAHEMIVALNVTDPDRYAKYRAGMTPILTRFGGAFNYDLVVSSVLKSPTSHPITRVFSIVFPDREVREAFFACPEYLRVREEHFAPATNGRTLTAEVDR